MPTHIHGVYREKDKRGNGLKTMMSRMRTMNPTIPPPVPYCQGAALATVMVSSATGAAAMRAAMQSWRQKGKAIETMIPESNSSGWLGMVAMVVDARMA